jgi:hypothetical protein
MCALALTLPGSRGTAPQGWDVACSLSVPPIVCTGPSVTSWAGVTCDANSKVTDISLVGSDLRGSIPTEIGLMTTLTQLNLNFNFITGTIPTETGQLSSLHYLDLSSNSLTGPVPSSLCSQSYDEFSLCTTRCSGNTAYPSCLNASILNVSPIPPYIPCPAGTRPYGIVDHRLVISTRLSCCRYLHPRC